MAAFESLIDPDSPIVDPRSPLIFDPAGYRPQPPTMTLARPPATLGTLTLAITQPRRARVRTRTVLRYSRMVETFYQTVSKKASFRWINVFWTT